MLLRDKHKFFINKNTKKKTKKFFLKQWRVEICFGLENERK